MEPYSETVYLCDPKKNKKCNKGGCAYNPLIPEKLRTCYATKGKEYARLDLGGEPCVLPEYREKRAEYIREISKQRQLLQ